MLVSQPTPTTDRETQQRPAPYATANTTRVGGVKRRTLGAFYVYIEHGGTHRKQTP